MDQELPISIAFENANTDTQHNHTTINVTSHNFQVFDVLFDTLNKFANEITIDFTNTGIKIITINNQKTLLLSVKLNSDSFVNYQTTQSNNRATFELTRLCAFIKQGKKEKQIKQSDAFSIRVDNKKIYFDFTDEITETTLTYNTHLLDSETEHLELPPNVTFEKSVEIKTSTFFKTCKLLNINSEYAKFSCDDQIFTIDAGDSLKSFNNNEHTKILLVNNNINTNMVCSLKHFIEFERLADLTSEMQLYFKNDYPMFACIELSTMGKILIGVSPVTEQNLI